MKSSQQGEQPGDFVGPYRLIKQIGEGGFGIVFEAEQEEPIKRRVALKIIKQGMDTREVILRFEAERQALAMMDHPNIAKVLDVGSTSGGRPYFVMEMVDGECISVYCDVKQLPVVERLKLFEQVCQAVQHAHTKGIIHRDLKPGNILVSDHDGQRFAKVIDFGIAKAISGRITDQAIVTQANIVIGTPMYMSPEQVSGSPDIDTRTDIYSLGVILYELLTGSTPLRSDTLRSAAVSEVIRIIREVEPPRPSARLAQSREALKSVAENRSAEPAKLTSTLRGELDWIVMKALEKERSRRYDAASDFASDLRRYLAGQPVMAAPPSGMYLARKFVQRHRGMALAASIATLSLLIGIVAFAWQANIARQRAAELDQVARFQAEMLARIKPLEAGKLLTEEYSTRFRQALEGAKLPEAQINEQHQGFLAQLSMINATDVATSFVDQTIIKPAIESIDAQFKGQPSVDATLTQTLADQYLSMGLFDLALPLQKRVYELREQTVGVSHPLTMTAKNNYGELLHYQGKLDVALDVYQEVLGLRRKALSAQHADTLATIANLGTLYHAMGDFTKAEQYYVEAIDGRRQVLGEEHPATIDVLGNFGRMMQDQGRLPEAEALYREVLLKKRKVLGEEHPETLVSINNLAALLRSMNKLEEAEPLYREAVAKSRIINGEFHPETLTFIGNLGVFLRTQNKLDEAEPFFREALEKRQQALGPEHPATLISTVNMGGLLQLQGKNDAAVAMLTPIEQSMRASFTGDNAFRIARFLLNMGKARAALGDFETAEMNLLEANSIYQATPGPSPADVAESHQAVIDLYGAMDAAMPAQGYAAKAGAWRGGQQPVDQVSAAPPAATSDKAMDMLHRSAIVLVAGVNYRSGPGIQHLRSGMLSTRGDAFETMGFSSASENCDTGWIRVKAQAGTVRSVLDGMWICLGHEGMQWIEVR